MSGRYGEPWRESKAGDAIVSSEPFAPGFYWDDKTHEAYGGMLTAESCSKENRRRIIACVNACEGVSTEALEELVQAGKRVRP